MNNFNLFKSHLDRYGYVSNYTGVNICKNKITHKRGGKYILRTKYNCCKQPFKKVVYYYFF